MSNELKPCPFCGGIADYTKFFNHDKQCMVYGIKCKKDGAVCCATPFFETPNEAESHWNTRPENPLQEQVNILSKGLIEISNELCDMGCKNIYIRAIKTLSDAGILS